MTESATDSAPLNRTETVYGHVHTGAGTEIMPDLRLSGPEKIDRTACQDQWGVRSAVPKLRPRHLSPVQDQVRDLLRNGTGNGDIRQSGDDALGCFYQAGPH